MACTSCEERRVMLVKAMNAFYAGDPATVAHSLQEVFGSVKIDAAKMAAFLFQVKLGEKKKPVRLDELATMFPLKKARVGRRPPKRKLTEPKHLEGTSGGPLTGV